MVFIFISWLRRYGHHIHSPNIDDDNDDDQFCKSGNYRFADMICYLSGAHISMAIPIRALVRENSFDLLGFFLFQKEMGPSEILFWATIHLANENEPQTIFNRWKRTSILWFVHSNLVISIVQLIS